MKQTAVDWLEKEFVKLEATLGVYGKMYELIEQAKEIEKQQIIDAVYYGHLKKWVDDNIENSYGEQYYTENYNK